MTRAASAANLVAAVALVCVGALVGGWVATSDVQRQVAEAEARADSADRAAAAWEDSALLASAQVRVDTVRLRETVVRWRTLTDTVFDSIPATPRELSIVAACDDVVASCEAARDAQAVEAGYLRETLFAERAGRGYEREAFLAMAKQERAARRRDRVWFTIVGAAVGVVAWEVAR